jgi:hypothetical protein
MKRAIAIAVALICACSLRAARNNAASCVSVDQCGGGNTCFLGQCRGHSAALGLVSVEVQPGGSSPFTTLQVAGLNLQQSVVQNFTPTPFVTVSGSVQQQQDSGAATAVKGATVTFTSQAPIIADRVQQVSAQADSSGAFSLRLPQDRFDVAVRPPPPDPPYQAPQAFSTGTGSTALFSAVLPSESSLVKIQGSLSAGGESLAGASVTAVDGAGDLISSPVLVTSGNNFALSLPPGTSSYFLQVGPPASIDSGSGISPAPGVLSLPNYQLPGSTNVVVPLPQVATLSGTVVDSLGTPLANVQVLARSTSAQQFTLSRTVNTASNGTFSFVLRAGEYQVEAAPPATVGQPAVSPSQRITIAASANNSVLLVCPPQVFHKQRVVLQNGKFAGPGFQVTATRADDPLLSTRTAITSATDSNGLFQITGDPGTYRVEITPPPSVAVPRHIAQIDLPADDNETNLSPFITLDAPLTVLGTVHGTPAGGKDTPLSGATVSFFALDAAGSSVLLGSAVTDDNGNYTCILPDISNP